MKKLLLFLVIINLIFYAKAQTQNAESQPSRIALSLTANATNSMSVNWRTLKEFPESKVQYALATSWTEFEKSVQEKKAKFEKKEFEPNQISYHYSAIIDNLQPDKKYLYRVGHDSIWSEWNQFETASTGNNSFIFTWFGDPQNDLKEHCSRIFRMAYKTAPNAKFWLFSGDLVSDPDDYLYDELFDASGFIFRTTPVMMVPGNHDRAFLKDSTGKIVKDKRGFRKRSYDIAEMFKSHFTFPENGPNGFAETTYFFDYQNVRFICINTNSKLKEQAVWLEDKLANNKNKWTVVMFHHPLYSTGKDRDEGKTREVFLDIFDKYHVDLVLTGHDHSYARTKKLVNSQVVDDKAKGTVYVLSVCGPKQYPIQDKYKNIMVKLTNHIQLFQIITVSKEKILFEAFTANGELYDKFELEKK